MAQVIDAQTARLIAIRATRLFDESLAGTEGSFAAISSLGSVQIDTISVVARAHHAILWSRVAGYSQDDIASLERSPRRVIEYWTHAAAYLPLGDYRYCLPRMKRVKERGYHWFRAEPAAIAYVRDRIASEGPLRAQDFQETMKGPRGWWDWKPAKVALEYLFHCGELVSIERRSFQKVYDLAERALPSGLDLRFPSAAEMADWYIDRAVSSLGVFSRDELAYMRKEDTEGIDSALSARLEAGSLIVVQVEGEGGARSGSRLRYAVPAIVEAARRRDHAVAAPRAAILSPFDPLIIDRRRTARLFGIDYQLECYLPESKRRFGYFALPILYDDGEGDLSFIGLVDAKADRGGGALLARRLALDPSKEAARRPARVAGAVAAALCRFARFNGTARVELGRVDCGPRMEASLRTALAKELRIAGAVGKITPCRGT